MKKLLLLVSILFTNVLLSQTITVDNASYTPAQKVNLLLGNSCVEVSNINQSSSQSVAYFNQNGSSFPISEGIIIRNGNAAFTQGSYTNSNLSSPTGLNTDPYLQALSNSSSGQTTPIQDVAFIEFDFIPTSNSFNFQFLYASNEYGQFQCISNDIFAFALTDLNTSVTTNLAVVPGTSTPVSVKNIRNSAFNSSCNSINPSLFSTYNVSNPAASTLNMRGHTVVMNAASAVIPNNPYRIRLAIADYGDSDFDSAVFIAAGSFTTDFDLGNDTTICDGDTFLLDTGLDNTYTFQWLLNGVPIPGAINPTYTVTQSGTYRVIIDKNTCHIEDEIVFSSLSVAMPIDLSICDTGAPTQNFDLTINDENQLGINSAIYDLFYYASQADVLTNTSIVNTTTYSSSGQTIYIKIFNTITGNFCDAEYTFELIITDVVVAGTGITGSICEDDTTPYDLTIHNPAIINGQTGTYAITYYTSQTDAQNNVNPTLNMQVFSSNPGVVTFWARIEDVSNPNCFDVTQIDITVQPSPVVDSIANIVECSSAILPNITNGNYYTGPDGTGTMLIAGDVIVDGGTYYIFSGPDPNGCSNQSSFNITLIEEYIPRLDNCGSFSVPAPPEGIGAFFTDFGGPNGSGALIPTGTIFSNTTQSTIIQPVFYYAEMNGSVCQDNQYAINIHPLPLVDVPVDVTYCDSYTLPVLSTGGNYFTGPGGTGTMLNAGDVISVNGPNFPGLYYVYGEIAHTDSAGQPNFCAIDTPFQINLVDTTQFSTVYGCGSYVLPPITYGGYYDMSGGQGNLIDPNIPLTVSQVVYYYTNTSVLPNCTDNLNYNVVINPLPAVDVIPSTSECGEFELPQLVNGTYYMLSGGPSTPGQVQLNAFQVIDLTGTNLAPDTPYYIFSGPDANNCTNESTFTIHIDPMPITDQVIDRIECDPYSIPQPTNGTIYTASDGPNGSGTVVDPATVFDTDNTFFIYNTDPATGCFVDNQFTIFYNGINLPDYPNVMVCEVENYALPALTHVPPSPTNNYTIDYYIDTDNDNVGDTVIPAGTVFNTPNTTTTIYVIATNTGRFGVVCNEVDTFDVVVSETPILPSYAAYDNQEYCGSYTLPVLPVGNYNVNYYSQPGGNATDIINPANYTFTNSTQTPQIIDVWVYAEATNNTTCNDEEHFQFTVYPLLQITIQGGIICVDPVTQALLTPYLLESGLNPALYTVEWILNGTIMGTGPDYLALQAGTYTVNFIKLTPDNPPDCNYQSTTVVVEQSSAAIATIEVSEPFNDLATVTVILNGGFGQYEYQLDNGFQQTSPVFYNVDSGDHTITIFDVLGNCNVTVLEFTIIKYPKFFTPNSDGYNDTWNILDLQDDTTAVVSIFDRYGKLIKQISPSGLGWDGTYNGKSLPSTDYWFVVNYTYNGEARIFKSHFSMKR